MIQIYDKASELKGALDKTFSDLKENQVLINSLLSFISRNTYNINGIHHKLYKNNNYPI